MPGVCFACEIHRAEFAGADQADAERAPFSGTGDEQPVEIHRGLLGSIPSRAI